MNEILEKLKKDKDKDIVKAIIFLLLFNFLSFWFNPFSIEVYMNSGLGRKFMLAPVFILPGILIALIAYKNNKKALFRQILFSVLINLIWAMLLLDFLQGNQCGGFPNVCVI